MPKFPVPKWDGGDYHSGVRSFGARREGGKRLHAACDLYAPVGSEVLAVADGVVVEGPKHFYLGTIAVAVQHESLGCVLRYGELQSKLAPDVTVGKRVKEGQVIGYIGQMRGLSVSMLHLEMYSGEASGSLWDNDRFNNRFIRRSDLVNPTQLIDSLRGKGGYNRSRVTPAAEPPPVRPGEPPLSTTGGRVQTRGSVGRSGRNWQSDTEKVQWLLNQAKSKYQAAGLGGLTYTRLVEDGRCGPRTRAAIEQFQRAVVKYRLPDARVDPGGRTLRLLNKIAGSRGAVRTDVRQERRMPDPPAVVSTETAGSSDQLLWAQKVPENVRPAFKQKVVQVSRNLGMNPNWLMACMAFETAWTLDPSKRCIIKGRTVAIGLIQFTDVGCSGLGKSKEELGAMDAVTQLDWVEKYFKKSNPSGGYKDAIDVYMVIFCPKAVGKADDYVMYAEANDGEKFKPYQSNKGLDKDGDKEITRAEAGAAIRDSLNRGLAFKA